MNRAAALAACALLTACATSSGPTPLAPRGYLTAEEIAPVAARVASMAVTGERPAPGAPPNPDRWWLAIAHVELRPPEAAQHFDCMLGTRLAAQPRPALTRLMARLLADAEALTRDAAGRRGHVPRPIAGDPALRPCQRVTPAIRDGAAFPAAAAVAGALYGESFAALSPDRGDGARRIGREIGASRAICRMNSEADVAAGVAGGDELFDLIARSAAFQADLEAARLEVAAARTEGLTNPSCAAERRALGPRPAAD